MATGPWPLLLVDACCCCCCRCGECCGRRHHSGVNAGVAAALRAGAGGWGGACVNVDEAVKEEGADVGVRVEGEGLRGCGARNSGCCFLWAEWRAWALLGRELDEGGEGRTDHRITVLSCIYRSAQAGSRRAEGWVLCRCKWPEVLVLL